MSVGIRDIASIGVADIDVYGISGRKIVSANTPKLLMFFRSEDQAKGLPKINTKTNTTDVDSKYDQSFGFDIFNERLYGNKTKVYKNGYIEKDSTGKEVEKSVGELETFYDNESSLSYELKDSGTSFFIDYDYTLSKKNKKRTNLNYYAPNILIKPGKEVKLYVKFFDTDTASKLNIEVTFQPSANKGIESVTNKLIFNKSEELLEFKIKTKLNEPIDAKTTITAFVKDSTGKDVEIGKLNLLPNKLLQAKLFFIDVFYDTTTATTSFNGAGMIKNLNEKALNQASIELISGGTNKTLFIKQTDEELDNGVYDGKPASGILANKGAGKPYELNDLDKALRIISSKFYENIVNEILTNIEVELKKLDVNDGITTRKFIDPSSYIKTEITSLNDPKRTYEIIFDGLFNYLKLGFDMNYIFAFICHNIETIVNTTTTATSTFTSRDEAMASVDAKEIIIPNNAIGKTMTLAHEIGHNFGVRHTFDISGAKPQIGDLKLAQQQTLENIMDYPKNGDADRRDFITYQWNVMRERNKLGVNTIADLSIRLNPDISKKWLIDYHNSQNLRYFSERLLSYLIQAYKLKYKLEDISSLLDYRDKILDVFSDRIRFSLNKL